MERKKKKDIWTMRKTSKKPAAKPLAVVSPSDDVFAPPSKKVKGKKPILLSSTGEESDEDDNADLYDEEEINDEEDVDDDEYVQDNVYEKFP